MADLIEFRVHFDSGDAPPFGTMAENAIQARKQAEAARPGEIVRKVKVVREKAGFVRIGDA